MNILIIDSATEYCSCALATEKDVLSLGQLAPRQHTELILPMIDQLLAQAELMPQQLTTVAFGCGPGSFTGLRIACGVAQGIAYAVDLPLLAISDLAALAQAAHEQHHASHVVAALDARMSQIYWGAYQFDEKDKIARLCGEEKVSQAQHVVIPSLAAADETSWLGTGSGWAAYATELQQTIARQGKIISAYFGETFPHASHMVPLARFAAAQGQFLSPELASPTYLRDWTLR
ncbi:tRNA (adenosine(37)-N6)-threonylcarbamoyltransferase complex dimerization subunit type 1 TsaB [Thioflexithrix psekupsensis]|uniref:tRNA threonylcarbamoyladenosine biosynthesis protein TsaB n=1 Tax=Thioflexithrix psekupsensis TaxID=1570016 RepID=A0A251X6E0_9GAMM|nr:tRNA (adenosine(37)-N6)-threonylcarbamoyltransferase complex dimerization subunit type 1 TsaB [Thioflexithrix psekupsensis]OUD12934.1 tRNA (adenosine(37)-N6)-threonylcarbamoyltransferase complex dimerization subunit type 1 TsaB [Thioflexithrix psekupsensis]